MRIATYLLFVFLAVFSYSCSEKEKDLKFEQKKSVEIVKKKMLGDLDKVFQLAFEFPEEAGRQLGEVYKTGLGREPFLSEDEDLILCKQKLESAISISRYVYAIKKEMNFFDYSQVHGYYNLLFNSGDFNPATDFSLLLQYVKELNSFLFEVKKNETKANRSLLTQKQDEMIEDFLNSAIKTVISKLRSYKEVCGRENLLENTNWFLVEFGYVESGNFKNEMEYKKASPYQITFGTDNSFRCDSILIPVPSLRGERDIEYARVRKLGKDISGGYYSKKPVPGLLYRAGSGIRPEGEYYIGDKFLLLVFHFYDDFDIVVTTEYMIDVEMLAGEEIIIPAREQSGAPSWYPNDPPFPRLPRTYVSMFNNKMHFSTYHKLGEDRRHAPFSLQKKRN